MTLLGSLTEERLVCFIVSIYVTGSFLQYVSYRDLYVYTQRWEADRWGRPLPRDMQFTWSVHAFVRPADLPGYKPHLGCSFSADLTWIRDVATAPPCSQNGARGRFVGLILRTSPLLLRLPCCVVRLAGSGWLFSAQGQTRFGIVMVNSSCQPLV